MIELMKNKVSRYLMLAFAFIISLFVVGGSQKVSADSFSGTDYSKAMIVTESFSYTYGYKFGSSIEYYSETVNNSNTFQRGSVDKYNGLWVRSGVQLNSSVTYKHNLYYVNVDLLNDGFNYLDDVLVLDGDTTERTGNYLFFNIILYSNTQDILNYVNNNENLWGIVYDTTKGIVENSLISKDFETFEDGYSYNTSTLNNNYFSTFQLVWFDGTDCTKYVAIGEMELRGINFMSEIPVSRIELHVFSWVELINGTGGGYTEEDLEESYNQGVEDGKASVDITSDNEEYAEEVINQKLENGELFREETLIQQSQYFGGVLMEVESSWNNMLIDIDGKINFLNEDIKNLFDINSSYIFTDYFPDGPTEKYEYYINLINLRWEEYVNEIKASVDITTDNQTAINNYIERFSYKTYSEYQQYGNSKYNEGREVGYNSGFKDGEMSIDITSNDNEVINKYITDNNMKTYSEYQEYGTQQYQIGMQNADLTLDNELAIQNFIRDNKYKNEVEFKEYGESQFDNGYSKGYKDNSFKSKALRVLDKIGDFMFGWLKD